MLKHTGQAGFSLVELLITVAIVGLMASAVAGVYQISQQTFTRASSLEAAQLGARAGLDRMANELRLIGSYWVGASGAGNAITAASSNSITFRANVDNVDALSVSNGAEVAVSGTASGTSVPLNISATATADAFKVYTGSGSALNDYIYIANAGTREVKQIASLSGSTINLPNTSPLTSTYPTGSIVRDVKTIAYAVNGTTLTRSQGGSGADPIVDNVTGLTFTYFGADGVTQTANAALIREIQIDLTVQGPDGSPRRMITRVRPRNLP